jgi:hypothetical protein
MTAYQIDGAENNLLLFYGRPSLSISVLWFSIYIQSQTSITHVLFTLKEGVFKKKLKIFNFFFKLIFVFVFYIILID